MRANKIYHELGRLVGITGDTGRTTNAIITWDAIISGLSNDFENLKKRQGELGKE